MRNVYIINPKAGKHDQTVQFMERIRAVHATHGEEPEIYLTQRAGFIFEGVMPCGFKRFDGEIFDNVCYSILRSEYDTGLISSVRRMR